MEQQQQQSRQQGPCSLGDAARSRAAFEAEGVYRANHDGLILAMESLEARIDRSLGEVVRRLDSLQEARDQHRLSLRQLGTQLPEVSQKLDQLWSQCQTYFPRVKEHDVHFSFFRTSFENHKQHMLDVTGGLSRSTRLQGSSSQPRGLLADSLRGPQALGLSPLETSA